MLRPITANTGPMILAMNTAGSMPRLPWRIVRRSSQSRRHAGLGACWGGGLGRGSHSCPFAGMTRIRFKGFFAVASHLVIPADGKPVGAAVSQLPPGSSPRNTFNVGRWRGMSTRGKLPPVQPLGGCDGKRQAEPERRPGESARDRRRIRPAHRPGRGTQRNRRQGRRGRHCAWAERGPGGGSKPSTPAAKAHAAVDPCNDVQ